jgi:hypothetical protein
VTGGGLGFCENEFHTQQTNIAPVPVRKINQLDEGHVWVIRSMSRIWGLSNAEIGRRFGLSRETVRDIVLRKTWKNV